ncbi:glycosyltransferase family 4 protein [Streptomyces sp. NPDC005962]|uniref:glycosyltransferase family 4 protein n=1 Tax=Streptomyces sp. NPDC005962 TaxID=3154466 RepID=UPI003407D3B0
MTNTDAPLTIAFVLLTYSPDEPAGIERAVDSLANGLRELGHRTLIVAAGPPCRNGPPDLVRLNSVSLPRPMLVDEMLTLLPDPAPVREEVRRVLSERRVDLVVWADAVAGLGYLSPAPPGARTALMVHFMRADQSMRESLEHRPDAVLAVSDFLIDQSRGAGLTCDGWQTLPNAVPVSVDPPGPDRRERLRLSGPVRVVARTDPQKGVAELLRAHPGHELGRPVEIVLASARFEWARGIQDQVLDECRALAEASPEVKILPALDWREVQPFLADAAVAVVPSTGPESFGNVAAEALSVGTPVISYGLGYLATLTGKAGRTVDLDDGPERLWWALARLLDDRAAYHAASQQGPQQVAAHTPAAVAREFLHATMAGAREVS